MWAVTVMSVFSLPMDVLFQLSPSFLSMYYMYISIDLKDTESTTFEWFPTPCSMQEDTTQILLASKLS